MDEGQPILAADRAPWQTPKLRRAYARCAVVALKSRVRAASGRFTTEPRATVVISALTVGAIATRGTAGLNTLTD
jgi:hypothetical protein